MSYGQPLGRPFLFVCLECANLAEEHLFEHLSSRLRHGRKDVGIGVECHYNRTVSESLTDNLRVLTRKQQEGCAGMSESVGSHGRW
jgi:hypothetical protein